MATNEQVNGWKKFIETMKGLTWKERFQHFWEYYKWIAIAAVVVIAMTISIVSSVVQNSKEMLYSGVCINLSMSDEGNAYLTEGWFAKLGGNEKKQQIELVPMALNLEANALTDVESANNEKLIAMVTTGELDYMLMDASALTNAGKNGMFAPLEGFLSPEMIAKFEGKIAKAIWQLSIFPICPLFRSILAVLIRSTSASLAIAAEKQIMKHFCSICWTGRSEIPRRVLEKSKSCGMIAVPQLFCKLGWF